ncbi:MAG TPA: cation diffusion facilitator family transporter [Acidobacteriaceae bacterium]|nr:cation diffusion facilitator family transporter [Acidobacteriaceae bacterium]
MDGSPETELQVRRGLRSSLISIGSNFALACCKCAVGVVGHSFALVADGIESLSDVVSSFIVYLGLRVAIKPPDKEHPYGHGKAEPVAAATVSIGMGAAAIGIAAEAIILIQTPHPLPHAYTLWVLLVVFGIKLLLGRYVASVARSISSTAVRTDAWHHLSDAIISLFAFIGISAALLTGDVRADDWAALFASPVILYNAWKQIRGPMDEILDRAPAPEIEQNIRVAAASVPGVVGLEKCFVRKVGFRYYVDLHVIVNGDLTVRRGHAISHLVEDKVLARVDRVAKVLVHIEPEEELLNPSQSDM